VEPKKKVLIITDGTDPINGIAESIYAALTVCTVEMCNAQEFAGNDLLPAEVFFIGCENPEPASFSYLSMFLKHINLADRSCGVFSTSGNTLKYLSGLVEKCEARAGKPLLVENREIKTDALNKWLEEIIK
jgi:hypothetical protein